MTVDGMEPKPHRRAPILSWDHLNYEVKTKDGTRQLLHDISGQVYAGELVAIMGSSGAGKTTLLNVLSGRVQGGRLYGDIKFNGHKRNPHTYKRMLAFVEQDDLMFATLSVEETLMASARLRLPNSQYTEADKQRRVTDTLRQLRLSHVKDTKIGGYGERGVSGGERKRVSIGVEMVTDPKLLVLDEPSSGLDSSSAEMVVALAKEMAQQRQLCTLMTIHQPSAEMVARFDKLILLAQGKLVYMGPAKDALAYFEMLGYPCTNSNPANFFIDLMTIDFASDEAMTESERRVQHLVESFAEFRASGKVISASNLIMNKSFASAATTNDPTAIQEKTSDTQIVQPLREVVVSSSGSSSSDDSTDSASPSNVHDMTGEAAFLATFEPPPMNRWIDEVIVLLKRDWLLCTRNSALVLGLFAECLVMMIFIGFVFFQLDNSQSSVQNRIGALFALTVQSTFPVIIPVMTVIMTGRDVLMRERSGGTYRMSSFFIAKSLSFFPLVFIPYFIMYTGIYFIAHLQYVAHKYFIGLGILSALLLTSLGFAFMVAMMVRSLEVAHIIAPVALATLMLFAGNLSNANAITPVLRWLKYICLYYYAYSGFMQNEFNGLEFTCGEGSAICYRTGKEVIDTYGLAQQPIFECTVLNIVLGLVFYAVAYCLLRWMTKPRYLWV